MPWVHSFGILPGKIQMLTEYYTTDGGIKKGEQLYNEQLKMENE
jgi:hypothetical protein